MVAETGVGRQGAIWDLERQLARERAARGPRPVAVLRMAEGNVITDRAELVCCWEATFVADFSGHAVMLPFGK